MREIERRPFPTNRRFVLGAMEAGRRMHPMTALMQVDVTEGWQRCKTDDLSPTAFILACVGRAVAAHPEVHAYRDWRGRLAIHRHVDIATMVEVETDTGPFPLAHVVHRADLRSVEDLSSEILAIRTDPTAGRSGRLLMRWGRWVGLIPGFATTLYTVARRSTTIRRGIGTVAVSSVGMMLGGNGFTIGVPTVASISVIVGGATRRPWVVDGEVSVRTVLDLSVQVDHRVVDGAPAARCGANLRQLLEHPDLIEWD